MENKAMKRMDDHYENENVYVDGRRACVTPANIETGMCPYIYREEYDNVLGCTVYCDYQGTCDFKSYCTRTEKGAVHHCNMITKHGR